MASVKIKFRISKIKNKEGALYIQLIHRRKIKLITTAFRLYPHEWNNSLASVCFDVCPAERNAYLLNLEAGLKEEMKQIRELIALLDKRSDYTVDELAEYYVNRSFNGNLFPFMDYQIKKLKSENRPKTASIYATTKRSFSRFRNGQDVKIDKIEGELIVKYQAYLKNTVITMNSISCYMRALRAIYNQAVNKGLAIQKNPFREVYTGIDKTAKRAVNKDVVFRLKKLNLSKQKSLELARDIFMFSFYMRGMSFVDMANLRKNNLKNGYITYTRSKTKQSLTVKVEKCMEEIISRHGKQTVDDYLLPIYTAQNRDHTSHLRTYNKRLRQISKLLELDKPLSSYVARHSWATLALHKGISVKVISECMGHENENTTRIYLASLDQTIIDKANAKIIALK
jgi:site-specific recombinase XerD